MEELLFLLLLWKDMNKLFNFYWKKENQMLILQRRFLCHSFSFWVCWFCFCSPSTGVEERVGGYWLIFVLSFIFFFKILFFWNLFFQVWVDPSSYCCWKWTWTNCSNFIGKRKTKCWSSRSGSFVVCFFLFFFFSVSHFSIVF